MKRNSNRNDGPAVIRCAIYTRKSTEEGLNQEFNSLDAQRESGEAYITSQKHEGWQCVPTRYDDGGFTGGNMDRPALRRLLSDIEAGLVDCVVVYKVDRLSRSLMDFSRIMETFDKHGATFVSVTQAFNTTSSMGRLTLNILLSFAQFEREIISERTRDKMAAARRKGKYIGGAPLLGYDIDRTASRLVINEREAAQVRQIFALYLEHEALLSTVSELDRRSVTTKKWTTQKGKQRGGKVFDKGSLYNLLTNAAYVGKIRYKDEVYEGQHDGIVDPAVFERVQRQLRSNNRNGGADVRNKYGALLKGLLRCGPCGCAMAHSHSTKDGTKRYRYYVCVKAQKRGWKTCPAKSVPAAEIERFVVEQVKAIGEDPNLIAETLAQARRQTEDAHAALAVERKGIHNDLGRLAGDIRTLVSTPGDQAGQLADLNEQMRLCERRLAEIHQEEGHLRSELIDEDEVAAALREFNPLWESLSPKEQARMLQLLIERVDYDGESIEVTFRPTGIKALTDEFLVEETAA